MKRQTLIRNSLFFVVVAALVAASLLTMHLARANQDARVTLRGQSVPLREHAHLLQAADANQVLHLSIGLQPADSGGLDHFLQGLLTPGSPWYHHYLTPEEFASRFAPSPQQVQQVVSFLQSQGIAIQSIAPNRLLLDATTTVVRAEQAFHVSINEYAFANHIFYANAQAPTIPAALQSVIGSIGGLDNSVREQPHISKARAATSGYGPAELSRAYDTAPVASVALQGEGQTVALFELDGYQAADIAKYFQHNTLGTPALSTVLLDGASGAAGQAALEVELDIEVVGAIAPQAAQLVYEGPNSIQGINDLYTRMVTDNKARVISTSWGLCEASTGQAEILTLDTIFKQAAAQGISIYAASGDTGAYDCGDTNLAVDSPADDPYVTGVGGTNLQLGTAGGYGSETVWADAGTSGNSTSGSGSGGGVSSIFVQPTWQTGSGVLSSLSSGQPCGAPPGQYCRQVPDISADADPASGYAVYCTVTAAGCSASGWLTVGGTSAAAPFWAGSTTLINQDLQGQNLPALGSANPALYALANSQQIAPAFHDITSGKNLYYPATADYDMASGLGSPDVSNLAQELVAYSGSMTPTPVPTTPVPTSTPTPPAGKNLLQNTGFENGQPPWQETSSGGYQIISTLNQHTGQAAAYLCGYAGCDDRIWQRFAVPTTYRSLSLSYWWYAQSSRSGTQCQDTFTVLLQTDTGKQIKILQHNCNTDLSGGWVQRSLDLSKLLAEYIGQHVSLLFRATTQAGSSSQISVFFVDDVHILTL